MFDLNYLADQFNLYLLIFVRVAGIVAATPILGSRMVPNILKIGMVGLTAFFLLPVVDADPTLFGNTLSDLALVIIKEMAIGYAMGFILSLVFMVLQMAGQMMEVPMGFSMVNVLDPMLGQQVPILGQFQYVLAVVTFLTLDGHHLVLKALADSFQLVPLGGWSFWPGFTEICIRAFSLSFRLGFQIALPVVAVLLITDVALGLIARTVPQMNVFILGFPLKIIIGLLFVMLLLPMYVAFMENLFSPSGDFFQYLRSVLGGRSLGV
ncbi:MAG: flagellar type III secretion system protein FliR [Firmicutes bacterium]|nr:flagellar type III secretion system protein FliR [Bacillota bacterium]